MVDSNKVVIKINYHGKDKTQKENVHPKVVTEWHFQRIVLAMFFSTVFIILLVYFYTGEPTVLEVVDRPLVNKGKELHGY